MPGCCAFGCRSRKSKKEDGITYHKFPRDVKIRKAWVEAVCRIDWEPTDRSTLCSLHFEEHLIDRTSVNVVRVKKGAVPTIFHTTGPSYTKKRRSKVAKTDNVEEVTDSCLKADSVSEKRIGCSEVAEPANVEEEHGYCLKADSVSEKRKSCSEVAEPDNVEEVTGSCLKADSVSEKLSVSRSDLIIIELKRKIEYLEYQNESKAKKIKSLQSFKRRAEKKIINLNEDIKSLKENDTLGILKSVTDFNEEFLMRLIYKKKNLPRPSGFSPEFRKFAAGLYNISPRAYDFVKNTFKCALPHERTIFKWNEQFNNGKPIYSNEALETFDLNSENASKPLVFSVMIDENQVEYESS